MACEGCSTIIVVGTIALLIVLFKLYIKLNTAWCRSQTCLVGKTIIITGANTGIGYDTALDLAKRGARILLACRDKNKADEARLRIVQETGNNNVVVKILDLTSLQSVRSFAQDINETEERLDILINNAGAFGLPEDKTADGLHLLMQVNYFSHFLLTNLLLKLLKKSAPSRIVNVSSLSAVFAKLDLEKLNESVGFRQYPNTKLCNILFTKDLAKRLEGTGVSVYSLHPGSVKTEILRQPKSLVAIILTILSNTFFTTSEEGAQTTIHVAVTKNLETYNGEHFDNCKPVKTYRKAADPGLAKKLWEKTEELVKLQPQLSAWTKTTYAAKSLK